MAEPLNFKRIVLAVVSIIVISTGLGVAYGSCVGAAKLTQRWMVGEP